jgi:hypothetical protein
MILLSRGKINFFITLVDLVAFCIESNNCLDLFEFFDRLVDGSNLSRVRKIAKKI